MFTVPEPSTTSCELQLLVDIQSKLCIVMKVTTFPVHFIDNICLPLLLKCNFDGIFTSIICISIFTSLRIMFLERKGYTYIGLYHLCYMLLAWSDLVIFALLCFLLTSVCYPQELWFCGDLTQQMRSFLLLCLSEMLAKFKLQSAV